MAYFVHFGGTSEDCREDLESVYYMEPFGPFPSKLDALTFARREMEKELLEFRTRHEDPDLTIEEQEVGNNYVLQIKIGEYEEHAVVGELHLPSAAQA